LIEREANHSHIVQENAKLLTDNYRTEDNQFLETHTAL